MIPTLSSPVETLAAITLRNDDGAVSGVRIEYKTAASSITVQLREGNLSTTFSRKHQTWLHGFREDFSQIYQGDTHQTLSVVPVGNSAVKITESGREFLYADTNRLSVSTTEVDGKAPHLNLWHWTEHDRLTGIKSKVHYAEINMATGVVSREAWGIYDKGREAHPLDTIVNRQPRHIERDEYGHVVRDTRTPWMRLKADIKPLT